LLSIVIAASCALLFAIATDELFNGLNSSGEIAVGLCVEGSVLLNIWEFPHRSRQSSYHTQFILTGVEVLEAAGTDEQIGEVMSHGSEYLIGRRKGDSVNGRRHVEHFTDACLLPGCHSS
jgi:hypothetical protein